MGADEASTSISSAAGTSAAASEPAGDSSLSDWEGVSWGLGKETTAVGSGNGGKGARGRVERGGGAIDLGGAYHLDCVGEYKSLICRIVLEEVCLKGKVRSWIACVAVDGSS